MEFMPFDEQCISRHRDGSNVECDRCARSFNCNLSSFDDLSLISKNIHHSIMKIETWKQRSETIQPLLWDALFETCVNSIGHGILKMENRYKRRIGAILQFEYKNYQEQNGQGEHLPVWISTCINETSFIIGVHDDGGGFSVKPEKTGNVAEKNSAEPKGAGFEKLLELGFSLYWNKTGNSILCAYRNPASLTGSPS